MEKAIIGKKIGMTQIFDEAGHVVPVTVIEAGPCTVVQKKTAEKDGYEAIQLGYQTVPERKLTKPETGHQKKAGITEFKKVLKEFRLEDCSKYEVGDELKAGRHQASRCSPSEGDPRFRSCGPPRRRHGRQQRSFPYLQGQDRRWPDGQRAGHRHEPGRHLR